MQQCAQCEARSAPRSSTARRTECATGVLGAGPLLRKEPHRLLAEWHRSGGAAARMQCRWPLSAWWSAADTSPRPSLEQNRTQNNTRRRSDAKHREHSSAGWSPMGTTLPVHCRASTSGSGGTSLDSRISAEIRASPSASPACTHRQAKRKHTNKPADDKHGGSDEGQSAA